MSRMREYVSSLYAVFWKDLRVELRSRETVGGMLVFALLAVLMFNFALDGQAVQSTGTAAGILWVVLVFAGTTGMNRVMLAEKNAGCFDGLLLAPVDRSAVYFGKVLANNLFMLVVAAVLVPVFSLLFPVNLCQLNIVVIIIPGTLGYSLAGMLLAAMTMQTRTRDMLLPVLLFPVALPVLMAAVRASGMLLEGYTLADAGYWISLLLVFDVIFAVLGWMLFETIVEE